MRRLSVLIAVFAAFLLLSTSLVSAQGETLLVETQSTETTVATDDLAESDQLAEDFIRNIMPSRGRKMLKSRGQRELNLTGATATLYSLLLNDITNIANGNRASTVIEYAYEDVYEQTAFTKGELHVESLIVDGKIASDAIAAINKINAYDLDAIVSTLLSRCPYELYWYDKTIGVRTSQSNGYSVAGDTISVSGTLTFYFSVSSDYSLNDDPYTYDITYGQSANAAAAKASQIVTDYASASDESKLRGYADEICALTSYNDEAAAGGIAYGNPWQLVWVFDENPNTNVVCEGYSKAFQYLCDLSTFTGDISVITVTGTMAGGTGEGPHMWNVVRLDDGFNYLVDVTNIDEGTIGYPNHLLLARCSSGHYTSGYDISGSFGSIRYSYDEDTMNHYSADDLSIRLADEAIVTAIDESTFPDDIFRAYVLNNIDQNNDSQLSNVEIESVYGIDVSQTEIASLEGIELFYNLQTLWCAESKITSLDVSNNTNLLDLVCYGNNLGESL